MSESERAAVIDQDAPPAAEPARRKVSHIGAPACFELELACQQLNAAFGGFGTYVVGSSIERPNWRDVDLRLILSDDEFRRLFPEAHDNGSWEFDPRWLVMTCAIAAWLRSRTGLPIDFQFQPQTYANAKHPGPRRPTGLRLTKRDPEETA